jgi:WD40 repeat protein
MSRRSELRRRRQLPQQQTQGIKRLAWVPRQREVVQSATAGTYVIGGKLFYASPPPVSNPQTPRDTLWFPVPTTVLDHTRLELLGAIASKMADVDRTAWWLRHLQQCSARESADQHSFQLAHVTAMWKSGQALEAIEQLKQWSTNAETPAELRLLLVQAHLQRNDLPEALRSLNAISDSSEGVRSLRRAIARQWGQHALVSTLEAHMGTVTSVAFSPDGKWLASGGVDRTVCIWNAATGQLRATLTEPQDIVLSVSYSPRGDLLASAGYDRAVRLWNADDLKPVAALRAHESAVRAAVFSPDGQRLASGGDDRVIIVWDVATGQPIAKLEGHGAPITSLSFNRSGTAIASASSDGSIRLWEVEAGKPATTLESSGGAARSVAFLQGDDRITAGFDAGGFAIWKRTDQDWTVHRFGVDAAVRSVAYDEKRNRIAIGLDDHALHLRDADTGDEQLILRGHTARVVTVAFAPGGEQLASAGFDGTIKLWSMVEPIESR